MVAAAGVYFGVTTSAKSDPMADLLMANVEALAQDENGIGGTLIDPCCQWERNGYYAGLRCSETHSICVNTTRHNGGYKSTCRYY
ncbi:MAG: NVEALA domain-containing protein [Rikenellaceae bacterium]|nr:NVEALA domain-containing protein [Rikenellaceae bacterium]